LQEKISLIEQLSASVVAISPLSALKSNELHESLHLTFTLATDHRNILAAEFGLVFTLPEPLLTVYTNFGINLNAANNDESFTLPIPATYLIDQHGLIRHAYINTDYTERLEPEEILTTLRSII
jgi:peroxiredoxin